MKTLLAVHGYPPELEGGTERNIRALAGGLAGRGHDVTVLAGTLEWSERLRRSSQEVDGVRVVKIHRDDFHYERWERLYHPGVSRMVAELIEETRPDVMHVHHWLRLTSDLVRLGASHRVPTLLTMHDFAVSCPRLHRVLPDGSFCGVPVDEAACGPCTNLDESAGTHASLAMRKSDFANELRLASRVFALSRSHVDRLRAVLPGDVVQIHEQPFRTNQSLRHSPAPTSPWPFRIMTLGQLSAHKGTHVVLEALQRTRHRGRIELHLHGAADSPDYDARLTKLSAGSHVVRHGHYEYAELERTPYHLAVLPSLSHETYGMVLDEVAMLGLPALVSDRGAYPERIGAGGQAFRAGDAEDLAGKIDELIDSPDVLDAMRLAVEPPDSFEDYVRFVETEYADAIARGPTTQPDRFDLLGHLELEHIRGDTCEREAQMWEDRARQAGGSP
jgi:glycosyltransferase involved in cell wall biosynthesis